MDPGFDAKRAVLLLDQSGVTSLAGSIHAKVEAAKELCDKTATPDAIESTLSMAKVLRALIAVAVDHAEDAIANFPPLNPVNARERLADIMTGASDRLCLSSTHWAVRHYILALTLRAISATCTTRKTLRKVVDSPTVTVFIQLLRSPRAQDREYARSIVYTLYARVRTVREDVFTGIQHELCAFVADDTARSCVPFGAEEMLELYHSMCQGFRMPMSDRYVNAFRRSVLPLVTHQHIAIFGQAMSRCVVEHVRLHPPLFNTVLAYVCRKWPWQVPRKAGLCFQLLTDAMGVVDNCAGWELTLAPLFPVLSRTFRSKRIECCAQATTLVSSSTFASIRALAGADTVDRLIASSVVEPVADAALQHWSDSARLLLTMLVAGDFLLPLFFEVPRGHEDKTTDTTSEPGIRSTRSETATEAGSSSQRARLDAAQLERLPAAAQHCVCLLADPRCAAMVEEGRVLAARWRGFQHSMDLARSAPEGQGTEPPPESSVVGSAEVLVKMAAQRIFVRVPLSPVILARLQNGTMTIRDVPARAVGRLDATPRRHQEPASEAKDDRPSSTRSRQGMPSRWLREERDAPSPRPATADSTSDPGRQTPRAKGDEEKSRGGSRRGREHSGAGRSHKTRGRAPQAAATVVTTPLDRDGGATEGKQPKRGFFSGFGRRGLPSIKGKK